MSKEESARVFVEAIRKLAKNPCDLNNLEDYLSRHFDTWLKRFANTPENLAAEMKMFSEMNDEV